MAIRPLARSLAVSQGKGIDQVAAQVSAVMESIELHHAEHFVPPGELYSLREALIESRFINPVSLPLRSDALFREERVIRWIEARNIQSHEAILVPREIVDRDSRVCNPKDEIFFSSSNGLASGNTLREAQIHGLCELIERDQITFWLIEKEILNSKKSTRVDVQTIDDLMCGNLVELVTAAGLGIAIWYVATNINLPCFVCSIWDSEGATHFQQRASGSGCHPFKRIALSRAITEAAQSRLTHISGARDDMYWAKYRESLPINAGNNIEFVKKTNLETEGVSYGMLPEASEIQDDKELVDWICKMLRQEVGSEPCFVDLSHRDSPISVVHVFCNDLEVSAKKELFCPGGRAMSALARAGFQ